MKVDETIGHQSCRFENRNGDRNLQLGMGISGIFFLSHTSPALDEAYLLLRVRSLCPAASGKALASCGCSVDPTL